MINRRSPVQLAPERVRAVPMRSGLHYECRQPEAWAVCATGKSAGSPESIRQPIQALVSTRPPVQTLGEAAPHKLPARILEQTPATSDHPSLPGQRVDRFPSTWPSLCHKDQKKRLRRGSTSRPHRHSPRTCTSVLNRLAWYGPIVERQVER